MDKSQTKQKTKLTPAPYEPFGPEWRAFMLKRPKEFLIDLIESASKEYNVVQLKGFQIWKDATKDFPPLDKQILLCYVSFPDKKDKENYFIYYEIGRLNSITVTSKGKEPEYISAENYDSVPAQYWLDIPEPPAPGKEGQG